MKKIFILLFTASLLVLTGCNDEDKPVAAPIGVSFSNTSYNLATADTPVQILFSSPAPEAGFITIKYVTTDVAYSTDFTTTPPSTGDATLSVPFNAGATTASFTFTKLVDAIEGEVKNVVFTITAVSVNATITGNPSTQVNFNETASLGTALEPQIGGALQANQVYIDLSSTELTTVPRVSWDLGFYAGSEFRVALNSSLKMAAKPLNTVNIDEVAQPDNTMLIGTGNGNPDYIDNPSGTINDLAIAAVSDNDDDNKVYLVNMGNDPSGTQPALGSEGSAGGAHRGWMKIRVLKSGNDYKMQYAAADATTHQEVTITKNSAFNFTFFSFTSNAVVNVEPQKTDWDINFTTFTNLVGGTIPYYYADFIVTNTKGGARSYEVLTSAFTYDAFQLKDVKESNFTEDQRNIGSNWRSTSTTGPDGIPVSQFSIRTDRFYVIKDPNGHYYKLQMTGAVLENGERGHPKFQYTLLQ